jgi:hypothetical protein
LLPHHTREAPQKKEDVMSTEKSSVKNIIAGPNEMDLMMSLFGRDHIETAVRFTVAVDHIQRRGYYLVKIIKLAHAVSPTCWNFEGICSSDSQMFAFGSYCHKTRKGHLFIKTA